MNRSEDGEVYFSDTGDSMIDSWEERLARGEDIDLTEAFAPGELEKINKAIQNAQGASAHIMQSKTLQEVNQELLEQFSKGQFNTFGK